MSRLDAVRNRRLDLVVVGGGIIGAGVARDASLRGLSVALFEKNDYGSGTTSGSTRLIHGGLRYLEMLDFGLVRMDLQERETLLRIAPHRVKPLEFLIPFYDRSLFHRAKMHAGMILYDALSLGKTLPRYRSLDAAEVLDAEPVLKRAGLQGGVAYFDAQVESPELLAVDNIVDARGLGAIALNYCEVTRGVVDARRVCGVRVRDLLDRDEAEVQARVVVNASGAWFNTVAPTLLLENSGRVRTTKGVHIATAPLTHRAIVLFTEADARLFFVIPLLGLGWIGTTDTDFKGDPGAVQASRGDVRYLIESAAAFVPVVRETPLYWTNAGVRALVMRPGRESDISRSHRIDSAPGLVSILGGKITGYRAIAEQAVNAVMQQLNGATKCGTAERQLPRAEASGEATLCDQVTQAVRDTQCQHLADFMLRRSTLGLRADQGVDAAVEVARLMGAQLGWTSERVEAETLAYAESVEKTRTSIEHA